MERLYGEFVRCIIISVYMKDSDRTWNIKR